MTKIRSLVIVILLLAMACTSPEPTRPGTSPPTPGPGDQGATAAARDAELAERPVSDRTATAVRRPAWLGRRHLPLRPDGYGEVLPTPPELRDRRLPPPDADIPALVGDGFRAEVSPPSDEVIGRSTWTAGCPVSRDDLRYVRLRFWGFDDRGHTGELLVHADTAEPIVRVFERLYDERFPIEEMRIVSPAELDAPATGDGNNTTAFVCRPIRGSASWSEHAYGRAVDVNPFHNPYTKGDLVLPELASAYTDRTWERPGMILPGDEVVAAFRDIGWGWGGDWSEPSDPMHFSATGR